MAKKILAVKDNTMECKKLGRGVKNYDDAEWAKVRYDIMVEVNYAELIIDNNNILNYSFSLDSNYNNPLDNFDDLDYTYG